MSADKVSSLRIRVDRVRYAFDKKLNVAKFALGTAFLVLAVVWLLLTF
jgi:hypothetical protein